MKIFTAIAAAAVIVASFTAAASAQEAGISVKVGYGDLNLNSSVGQDILARRINAAANKACAVDPGERDLSVRLNAWRCHATAMSGARTAVAAITAPIYASR